MSLDGLTPLLPQHVLLLQVAEGEYCPLNRDTVSVQLDAGKAMHPAHLDKGLYHCGSLN